MFFRLVFNQILRETVLRVAMIVSKLFPLHSYRNRLLREYYKRITVQRSPQEGGLLEEFKTFMEGEIRNSVPAFQEFRYSGSYYEGLHVAGKSDYDINVIINKRDVTTEECRNGYSFLHKGGQPLVPETEVSNFMGSLQRIVNRASQWRCILRRHGPAVQVDVERQGIQISIDFAICHRVGNKYFVAKPYNGPEYYPNANLTWRRAFSAEDVEKLRNADRGNGCRRQCLRLVKAIFKADPPLRCIQSYALKTTLFYAMEDAKQPQWSVSNLYNCWIYLLNKFLEYVRQGYLEHCHIRNLNLLEGIPRNVLENVAGRLSRLINSPVKQREVLE